MDHIRRTPWLWFLLLVGCLPCRKDPPFIPSAMIDGGPPEDGAAPVDGSEPEPPLETPAEELESWPFDYVPTADDRTLLFSNFPEALTADNTAESPTPVAFFRAVVRSGERYRLLFDHFNRTGNSEATLEREGLPDRCNDPKALSIYLQVQAVAETTDGETSRVTIVREVTRRVKVEASQEPFVDFLADPSIGAAADDFAHPELYEHRLVSGVQSSELFVGAIDFNIVGDAPGYVVSLVASEVDDGEPGLEGLRYHGFAHTECMKPSDWRRQYMGELSSDTVSARIPLMVGCDDTTADDNTIFHGDGGEPLTQNAPGGTEPGANARPLLWGTNAHFELGGEARPGLWPDRGWVNLYDLMDIATSRATPSDLEPDYLAPLRPDGIRPEEPNDRFLYHRMYDKGRPTVADPTGGRDHTWNDNAPQFPNWPNFGVVYRHELEVRNECHLPRRIHVHLHRPALVSTATGGRTGVWDRPMPCNVSTSNGLALRRNDGAWDGARLGACRSDNVERSPSTEYPAEERGGLMRIVTLDLPPGETVRYPYEFMLTPPSTQNLVHVVTLDPIRRVEVPACFSSYVYRPFEGRHRWRNWSGDLEGGTPFDFVIDEVDYPGERATEGDAIAFTPTEPGTTALVRYRYHDEGRTPLHEKCDASCPEASATACADGGGGDRCRELCERELELCGPAARCEGGNCISDGALHAARLDPLSAVSDGEGLIEIQVADCPPGTRWNGAARECQTEPPSIVGTSCPASGSQVDWTALRSEAEAFHDPSALFFTAEIPYDPQPDFPGYESGPCGSVTYELPVPCGDGYQDYTAWRLGGAVAVFRVRDGLPGTGGFNRWVHNPGYTADGMMDLDYTHPAKTTLVSCSGGGLFGGCSFGTYGEDRSSLTLCNAARTDAEPGPPQPGPGAYDGRIRAFPVHRRDEPDMSLPEGYRVCFDRLHLAAQGGGIAVACQSGDGLEHGRIFIGFEAVQAACP